MFDFGHGSSSNFVVVFGSSVGLGSEVGEEERGFMGQNRFDRCHRLKLTYM